MKIRYNAPVVLTISIASTVVLVISQVLGKDAGGNFLNLFVVPGTGDHINIFSIQAYRLLSYVIAHAGWEHFIGNISFLLLLGPILEEKYGSVRIFFLVIITAVASGLINVFFLPNPSLGASGIVFMLILLVSITNVKKGEIPLTLIAVILIFVLKEVLAMFFEKNNINEIAHLVGGLFGGIFGLLLAKNEPPRDESVKSNPPSPNITYDGT